MPLSLTITVWLKKGLLHDVFSVYLLDSRVSDDCLTSVFLPLNVAEQRMYDSFRQYVLVNGCRVSYMSACTFCMVLLFLILFPVYLSACCGELTCS